jgi:hypothetical protein
MWAGAAWAGRDRGRVRLLELGPDGIREVAYEDTEHFGVTRDFLLRRDAIAKTRKLSANRVLVDLIETGLQARESERERFLTLARRFKESSDPDESDRLREELAHVIFGE